MWRLAVYSMIATVQIAAAHSYAKGDTVRITITGGDLAAPIEITDRSEIQRAGTYKFAASSPLVSRKYVRRGMTDHERGLTGIDKLAVPRSDIPAVTHVDYSARIQTVHAETNPRYHELISAFKERTGCPVIVNTSFNVRGEPIVCTPEDAFQCFMATEIDALVIGNCFLRKEEQNSALRSNYARTLEPD